jgi:hypothetical protein
MDDEYDEFYSKDDVAAFQRVGEFLCWFAMLETNMDTSIVGLLGVEETAGRLLLSYVPFSRKCDFLRELICLEAVGFTDAERKEAKGKVGEIQQKADLRNIVAHSYFLAQEGGVKFMRAKKKMRADTSEVWDKDVFRRHRTDMVDLWGWVAKISGQIRQKMPEAQIARALAEQLAKERAAPFSKLH